MINTLLYYYCHSFYNNKLNLTEENKKQEPCRQHSTMSLIKYQNQYPKIWIIPKEIKFYQKNDTQNSGNSPKRYPKIQEHPKKVPKITAQSRILTFGSSPPPHTHTPKSFSEKVFAAQSYFRIIIIATNIDSI